MPPPPPPTTASASRGAVRLLLSSVRALQLDARDRGRLKDLVVGGDPRVVRVAEDFLADALDTPAFAAAVRAAVAGCACAACGEAVLLDEGVRAVDRVFHRNHLVCSVCSVALADGEFFGGDGRAFCAQHAACPVCGEGLDAGGAAIAVDGVPMHDACFACKACGQSLRGVDSYKDVPGAGLFCDPACPSPAGRASEDEFESDFEDCEGDVECSECHRVVAEAHDVDAHDAERPDAEAPCDACVLRVAGLGIRLCNACISSSSSVPPPAPASAPSDTCTECSRVVAEAHGVDAHDAERPGVEAPCDACMLRVPGVGMRLCSGCMTAVGGSLSDSLSESDDSAVDSPVHSSDSDSPFEDSEDEDDSSVASGDSPFEDSEDDSDASSSSDAVEVTTEVDDFESDFEDDVDGSNLGDVECTHCHRVVAGAHAVDAHDAQRPDAEAPCDACVLQMTAVGIRLCNACIGSTT